MLDFRDHVWQSFDIQPILAELLVVGAKHPSPCLQPPITVHVPGIVVDGPQIESGDDALDDDAPQPAVGILDPHVLQAILDVESAAKSHDHMGRMIIRFEAHSFKQELADNAKFDNFFQISDERPWANQQWIRTQMGDLSPIHTGNQATEYMAFDLAKQLDVEAAHRSVGMGLGQTMGFNHRRLGYPSAQAMFADMQASATAQIIGMLNYIIGDSVLVDAIKRKDWRTIARLYNGAGNVEKYSGLLEAAYERRVTA